MLTFILNVLVSIVVLKLVMRHCQFLASVFWYRDCQWYAAKYGINSWALVTDAAGGIGHGFAEGLTKRGLNAILIGRNLAHLRAKEKDLHKVNSEVQTKMIEFDFAHDTSISDYQTKIYDQTSDLEVSFLVNNAGLAVAGLGEPSGDPATEGVAGDRQTLAALITNIFANTTLLHRFIPIFNKRA
jgi:short-subunit dehydrogenase